MSREDWLYVGCKLIGVVLGVSGLIAAIYVLVLSLLATEEQADSLMGIWDGHVSFHWTSLVDPGIRIVFAYILIRHTHWCVGLICRESRQSDAL